MASRDPQLLTDVRLVLRHQTWRPVYEVDSDGRDLALASGRENLQQAVILRLLTPRGELAALGHPQYGSRLHELIGEPASETRRNVAKVHILEALGAEPRIAKVEKVIVEPLPADPAQRDFLRVAVDVLPVGEVGSVVIGPFTLKVGG